MNSNRVLFWLLVLIVTCGCAFAQEATLQGTVTDPSDLAVPNATIDLKNVSTGIVRTTASTAEGIFRFNSVAAGIYALTIRPSAGFKEYVQQQITLNASEIRDLGRIKLTMGTVDQTVEVTAAATPVQTASSENASLVDFTQMAEITVRGRDLMSLLQTLPGVNFGSNYLTQGGSGQSNYETVNPFALGAMNLNGQGSAANYTVDGVTGMDMAGDSLTTFQPNTDAVAEVRVLSTNYAAEYGRDLGGQLQVVTKSGTQEFHGTLNINKRHEMFNANSFFNNYNGQTKSFYRFFDTAYSIGGPIYIPKHFNVQKKKIFFFLSQDFLGQRSNPATGYANVPNPNQRIGDFSFYPNSQGNFISNSLRNPVTGATFTPWSGAAAGPYGGQQDFSQFASSFDPVSQKYGAAMMAALPLPNLCNAASGTSDGKAWNGIGAGIQGSNLISPTNCPSWITSQATGLASGNIDIQGGPGTTNNYTRNYYWIYNGNIKRRDDIARIDLNLTSKMTAFVRFGHDYFLDNSAGSIPLKSDKTGQFQPTYEPHPNPGRGWAVGSTYTISPTLVNQITLGYSWNDYAYDLNTDQLSRANMGNPPSFHNFSTDPLYNMPAVSRPETPDGQAWFYPGFPSANFGGGQWSETGAGQPFCNGTCPNYNFNPMYSVDDKISKTVGTHNFKAGVYWEWNQKQETGGNNSQGTYNFTGANDPFFTANTYDGLANAYLGNISSYQEGQRFIGYKTSVALEAFIQDSWRVSRRLTLDLGVRFSHLPAMQDVKENSTMFDGDTYNPTLAEHIFYPYCSVSTATAACPKANQYVWDKATNPNAAIGTGNGGPGNMYPSYIASGTLVPATFNGISTGYATTPNPFTGMQQLAWNNSTLPLQNGVYQVPRFSPAFRFGFAWDVFGNGKTAVRGGFGQNLRREPNAILNGNVGGSPVGLTLTQYYGTIASVAKNPLAGYTESNMPNANQVIGLSPYATNWITGFKRYETSYNGSLEVQRDVGFSTVVQAGWVFVMNRHASLNETMNNVTSLGTPMGWGSLFDQIQPAAANQTQLYLNQYLPGNASGINLNANYFRSQFPGYGAITYNCFCGSSDYHSFQASVRRNFTKRLSYSLSYTWNKTMSLASGRSSVFTDKYRNWGPSFSPTPQFATVTYVYQVPNISAKLTNGFAKSAMRWVTDDWEWSGVTSLRSDIKTGVPSISFANTNSTNLVTPLTTGTTLEGARMIILGPLNLPSDQVSFKGGPTTTNIGVNGTPGNAILNNANIMIPNPCSYTANANPRVGVGMNMSCFGNAGAGSLVTLPNTRVNDWDMTFRKRFPLKSEKRTLEFRAEMYNIWNHTQFIGAATGQSYDWNNWKTNGVLVPTNGSTGRYNSAVNPRLMSMAVRFTF